MKIASIACVLPLLLMSCGGSSSTDTPVSIHTVSSVNAVSSTTSVSSVSSVNDANNEYKKLLQNHRQKWSQRNIQSYQYQYSVSCFCLPDITDKKQVTVFDGAVSEAFFLTTSDYLTQKQLTQIKTIDQLFDLIDDAINAKAYKLKVSYNQEYGYPESISIDYYRDMADDEISYYVSNLM